MFDWRQWVGGWRGVDCSRRGSPARCRRRALLGALGCVVLLAWPVAAEEMATAVPDASLKARRQAFWEARITEARDAPRHR
jgi:hypothetical protein